MARESFMPAAKADQVAWAAHFTSVLSPSPTSYGVTTALFSQFEDLNTGLQAAWTKSQAEATRTKVTINQRDQLLAQMKQLASKLVSIIQGTPTVTADMLIAAGLTVRSTRPKPRPTPSTAPFLVVTNVSGRTVTLELRQDRAKRGRPADVASASVFTAAAGASLTDTAAWSFYGNTNKTTLDVTFPPSPVGDTVQLAAFWSNTRSESGPTAQPITVNLPASTAVPGVTRLKVAA